MLPCEFPILGQLLRPPIRVPSQSFRHDFCCGLGSGEPEVRAEEEERRAPVHEIDQCECHLPLHSQSDLTPERRHLRMERLQPGRIGGGELEQMVELLSV